jgi:predicted ATPase
MISTLRLVDFKNFGEAKLQLGNFTLIVGTNASGKSNIRDAFRFLHGIGRGYSLADIIGGRYGPGGQVEWAQMRGAAKEIVRFGESSFGIVLDFRIDSRAGTYGIEVARSSHGRGGFRVEHETLKVEGDEIFTSSPNDGDPALQGGDEAYLAVRLAKLPNQKKFGHRFLARRDQPVLSQIAEFDKAGKKHREAAAALMDLLAGIRFLDLIPDLMRNPAFPGQTSVGDSGENLPTALQAICADPEKKSALMDWVRELTPMDVIDFEFPADPLTSRVQLSVKESSGNMVSAYSMSDGTLRFLAMLASLLGPQSARLYFFEEIDNGIHPSRLRLLLDLIERQTEKAAIQVVTTTHSPDLLSMISDRTFESTSVVFQPPGGAGATIRRVADLPRARELRSSQGLGRLHAAGWMEDVLFFSDDTAEAAAQ